MKILFIGGNGNISWYCMQEAINRSHKVWALHRGVTVKTRRDFQSEVNILHADFRNRDEVKKVLSDHIFDVVVDFICYNEEQAKLDVEIFNNITNHFIFISSVSVYERATINLPYRENSPKCKNSVREYANDKLKAEEVFTNAYKDLNFPVTIVRPGYTYDTIIPVSVGLNDWTVCQRILNGKPPIILGDGSNIFTFTHSKDFAKALIPLFNNAKAVGEDFNITSDEILNWKEATDILVDILNANNLEYLYIPTKYVCKYLEYLQPLKTERKNKYCPSLAHSLSHMASDFKSQKMWCDLFDNSKIKSFVLHWKPNITLSEGLRETIQWMNEKEEHKRVDPNLNAILDGLTEKFKYLLK
jgi:nucleoside-diphosphate-sugar epimerase